MIFKPVVSLLISTFLSLSLLPGVPENNRPLTLLVYMAGSDLESLGGAASKDLAEMAKAVDDSSVTIAVLTGGANTWQNGISADQNILWQVSSQGLAEVERYTDRSLGDPDVLSSFLKRGTELFPADNYALVLWDHGGGPLNGVCFDERHEMDGLSLTELHNALSDSPFAQDPLIFIGFDACLMASAEVAETVAPYAECMIASQEPEPACGWDYAFLSKLGSACNGPDAGRLIVDAYADSQSNVLSPVTLSCIQLSKIPALHSAMDEYFGAISAQTDNNTYSLLASSRSKTKSLGAAAPMDWDLVDLRDLCDMLEKAGMGDASALKLALDEAVICSWANEPYVCGLSVYSPFYNKNQYTYPWASRYRSFDFSENYQSYMQAFAREWMGQMHVSWQDSVAVQAEADAQRQRITAKLTNVEAADVASARLLVLEELTEGQYRLLYASDPLQPVHGELSEVYNNEALYMLDDDGNILCGPLEPRFMETGIAVFGLLENLEDSDYNLYDLWTTWMPDNNGQYELAEYYVYNDELDSYNVIANPMKPGNDINFGLYGRCIPDDKTPYEQWPYGDAIRFNHVRYTGQTDWHLKYLPLQSDKNRIALFEITDLHANTFLTSPITLDNTAQLSLLDTPQTVRSSGFSLSLTDASLFTGANAGLRLNFTFRGSWPEGIKADIDTVMLDNTALLNFNTLRHLDASGEEIKMTMELEAETLQYCHIDSVSRIRLYLSALKDYRRMEGAWFDFELPVDLSMIVSAQAETPQPSAVFEQDGLCFELFGSSADPYGDINCDIHLINRSGIEKTIDFSDGSINGLHLLFGIPWSDGPYVLPPDSESWFPFRFYISFEAGEHKELFPAELSDIRQIGFNLQQEITVPFDLP